MREPNETEQERIPGAMLAPLSQFDPVHLPDPQGRTVVFTCGSGIRSIKAAEIAQAAGLAFDGHLTGGIKAWKAAGLAIENDARARSGNADDIFHCRMAPRPGRRAVIVAR